MHKDRNWLCQVFHHEEYQSEEFVKLSAGYQQGKGKRFIQCTFTDCVLHDFDFSGSNFVACSFLRCQLNRIKFEGAKLSQVVFEECELTDISFRDCAEDDFSVVLKKCTVGNCMMPEKGVTIE